MDTLLTILGISLFVPFFIQCFRTPWSRDTWPRQLLLTALLLQWTAVMYIPSVMYICLGVLAVALIIYAVCARPAFRLTPFLVICALYLAWFAVSLTWSVVPAKGARFLLDRGGPLLVFALLGCTLSTTAGERLHMLRQACHVAYIFIAMTLLTWLVSCVELHLYPWQWPILKKSIVGDIELYHWVFRWLGGLKGYTHPSYNLLPLFAVTSMAIALRKERAMPAYAWWLLWAGGAVITLLVQSRMGIVFALIEIVAYIILMQPTVRRAVIATMAVGCVGLVAIGGTLSFWRQYGSDPIRDTLTTRTWQYIQAKPWTGAGAGALNPVEICHTIGATDWPRVGAITPDMRVEDWKPRTRMLPHNQWLADWAHAGLPAALLCLALYLCLAIRGLRTRRLAAMTFLLIFIIFSLLEPPLYIGKGLYLFGLLSTYLYLKREEA
ncbi:MAG: O-antigen ligase family protein [Paludibacteraceae bacterium]|nr:O-antigen ligase family protein [Paludibacteraceae bacterium]